jgi:hypothetical protein
MVRDDSVGGPPLAIAAKTLHAPLAASPSGVPRYDPLPLGPPEPDEEAPMSRVSLLLAALLVAPGCDGGKPGDTNAKADGKQPAAGGPTASPTDPSASAAGEPAAAAPADPWQAKLAARVLAESGLGKDGKLTAFDIVDGESGEQYCQVCRYGSSPKVMAVGSLDDAAFHEDLKNLDAIVKKYGDDKLKAFAVVTEIVDGKGVTPRDAEAMRQQANALRQKLAISFPVVVPAPDEGGGNREWDEYYNITKSRTVMFADGRNTVHWSAVGPTDWSGLNEAVKSLVEPS